MKIQDEGIVINSIKYNDHAVILSILTLNHGLKKGIFNGAFSKKNLSSKDIGSYVDLTWHSKTEDSLGYFKLELKRYYGALVIDNILKSKIIITMCAILSKSLIGENPDQKLYHNTLSTIHNIALIKDTNDIISYISWESNLLTYMGYGLNLKKCVVTNSTDNLCYISPKTGNAVSYEAGKIWHNQLFPMPHILKNSTYKNKDDALLALKVLGHFLNHISDNFLDINSYRGSLIKQVDKHLS